MRNLDDYWSPRQLKWILVGFAIVIAIIWVVVSLGEHEPSRLAFHKYMDALADGRIDEALAEVCPASKEAMPDYRERLIATLNDIGRIESYGDLRATRKGLGAAFVDGSRSDARIFMRMTKVDRTWMACPTEGPLGRIESA